MALALGSERVLGNSTSINAPQFGADGDTLYWNTIGGGPTQYFKYTISTDTVTQVLAADALLAYRTTSKDGTHSVSGGNLLQAGDAGVGTLLSPSGPYAASAATGLGFSEDDRFILYDFRNPAAPAIDYYFFKNVGSPVHAANDTVAVPDNNFASVDVFANDVDSDAGDIKQITLLGQGARTTAVVGNNTANFVLHNDVEISTSRNGPISVGFPPPSLPQGFQDSQTFYYNERDLGGWASRGSVTVTYTGVNDKPQTHNPGNTVVINEDSGPNPIGIGAPTDADGDAIASIQIDKLPSRGIVALANGTPVTVGMQISIADLTGLTIQSRPNEFGTTAVQPLQYLVTDSHGAIAVGQVGFNILNVEDAPVAEANKTVVVATNSTAAPLSIAAPTDVDGDQLFVTVTELPSSGVVKLSTGTAVSVNQQLTVSQLTQLTYATAAGFAGTAGAFSYSVSDHQGGAASQTVGLAVINASLPTISVSADFNFDHRSDLLWHNSTFGNEVWHMNGPTTLSTAQVPALASGFTGHIGDFNGDGIADLFWFNQSTGQTQMWIMEDNRVISSTTMTQMSSGWSPTVVGDLNGDEKSDLLWHHNSLGLNEIWLMNGASPTATKALPNVSSDWVLAATGDFNGDFSPDLLWHNQATGYNDIWSIPNGTYLSEKALPPTSAGWTVSASGDFNGDGRADLLWQHTSGLLEFWFMVGGAVSSISDTSLAAASDTVAATGDYNGDGRADLVWQHHPGNTLTMWLMNGGTATMSNFGVVNDGWSPIT